MSARFKRRALGELRPAINAVKWHMNVDSSGFHTKRRQTAVNEDQAGEGEEMYYVKAQKQTPLSSCRVQEGSRSAFNAKVRKRKFLIVSHAQGKRRSIGQKSAPELQALERATHWQFDENDYVIESHVKQCVNYTDGVAKQYMMGLVNHSPEESETEAYIDSDVIDASF